jgi:two-component system chemotaxis response regulator CheB
VSAIRVATADDSELSRALLRELIVARRELCLVAETSSVQELEDAVSRKKPHVVTLDLLMPGRGGLGAIRRLAEHAEVVVVSDERAGSPLANESLAQGACAFVQKRTLGSAEGRARFLSALLDAPQHRKVERIVAIAGSTGAMPALARFAHVLGASQAAVTIVQHLPAARMGAFCEWLTSVGLTAQVAERPLLLSRGQAVVAPGHRHLVVLEGDRAELDDSPPVAGHRPSADFLFRSLVHAAPHTLAVVLSGMGRDGARGLGPLLASGASCIVQRADTCAVFAMPRAAQEAAQKAAKNAALALHPNEIGAAIQSWLGGKRLG